MLPEPVGLKENRYFPWSDLCTPRIVSDAWESVITTVNRSWYFGSTLTLPPSCLTIRSPLPPQVIFKNCANAAEPSRVYFQTRVKSRVSIANDRSDLSGYRYIICPKTPYPACWKILDRRQLFFLAVPPWPVIKILCPSRTIFSAWRWSSESLSNINRARL